MMRSFIEKSASEQDNEKGRSNIMKFHVSG